MGASERDKGKRGERQVAALIADELGFQVRRRVRQDQGDSDLVGVPGWSLEVKDRKTATRGQLKEWWAQTVAQAATERQLRPVLIYKRAPGWWRCVWSPLGGLHADWQWTVEGELAVWAAVVREMLT